MTDYATLLRDHVTLKVRSIDRVFLQGYVPLLQTVGYVCRFLRWQRNFPIPSSAAFGKIGQQYVRAIQRFAEEHKIPRLKFEKGQDKEKIALPYLESAAKQGQDQVVLIGSAQEKASIWKSWPRKGQEKAAHPHMDWGRQMAYIDHFYFCLWDREWGGSFCKTNAYAPFPIWLWLNGHEWAKRQLEKAGIGYQALDNGFRSCANPTALQEICDRLGAAEVESFLARWLHRLPSPFRAADQQAGYTYQLAFRQFEISETCVFDRPQAGRMWFEGVIRDHLDVGRPDQIALFFRRRILAHSRVQFRTRVLNPGVDPLLCCYYKSSRLKQYFKEGRALRTETVIANTKDFDVGRRMCAENWKALRAAGESVNRRLCEAEAADAKPAPDVATFYHVTRPSTTPAGLHAPGLRFGEPRVMAVLGALVGFAYLVAGFGNRQLVERVGALLHAPYAPRQATYDLRRLQRKGLIAKLPHGHTYRLTSVGRRVAVLFTKAYGRLLAPGLSALDLHFPDDVIERRPLSRTWHSFDKALDDFVEQQMIAA